MVGVEWSKNAINDLEEIRAFISLDSPERAGRQIARIIVRTRQAALLPRSGRVVPEYNNPVIRELIEGKYRIIYEVKPEGVSILNIIHGARLLK